ncbi:MAG: hypothetical protein AAGA80_18230 [Cyanobacteria bacterium P01_F01_bin.143]
MLNFSWDTPMPNIMPQTQQSNKTLGKFSKKLAKLAYKATCYQASAVKHITDWKAALGQILIYSAFHPEPHQQKHLLDRDIKATCLTFDVNVTAEEIK